MDTYNMTKDEFKKYAITRQFTDMPTNDQFGIVWGRLTPDERKYLIKIIRNNSLQDIKDSDELKKQILLTFTEARNITLDIEIILDQIKGFDDDIPINYFG